MKILILVYTLLFSSLLFARPQFIADTQVRPGKFYLYPEGVKPKEACDLTTYLVLDRTDNIGNFALLRAVMLPKNSPGSCGYSLPPAIKYVQLYFVSDDCGSRTFKGQVVSSNKLVDVRVQDNRNYKCFDPKPTIKVQYGTLTLTTYDN